MRFAKACLPVVLTSVLLVGAPAAAAPGVDADIPRPVTAAARVLHCDIINTVTTSPGEKPVYSGETCENKRYGFYSVRWYQSAKQAKAYWADLLDGYPNAWIARKGRLYVIPANPNLPYEEGAARWAAKKIDGRAVHGRSAL